MLCSAVRFRLGLSFILLSLGLSCSYSSQNLVIGTLSYPLVHQISRRLAEHRMTEVTVGKSSSEVGDLFFTSGK